jgi:hypothetical protein
MGDDQDIEIQKRARVMPVFPVYLTGKFHGASVKSIRRVLSSLRLRVSDEWSLRQYCNIKPGVERLTIFASSGPFQAELIGFVSCCEFCQHLGIEIEDVKSAGSGLLRNLSRERC